MSLILTGLIVAAASGATFLAGRMFARRGAAGAKAEGESPDGEADGATAAESPPEQTKRKAPTRDAPDDALAGFPCQLGDVVMRKDGDEAWLAGALVLSEDVAVSALFFAPDAGAERVIYARPKPRASVAWLESLDPSEVLVGGEPPTSLEHDGVRFERARRIPLRARRVGVGAADVGGSVVLAEYTSMGSERLVLVKGDVARAFRGVELDEGTFEVIASGRSTLDD
ncbi:MAG: hypothetical protein KC657_03195 [Myxococcales bacterium]|nr:hypothetical protein [Myxococcales bacterium]